MDEGQLSELFAEAAEEAGRGAPPAGFDRDAVLAGSARAAARARKWQTGAVAAAVAVMAGAGLLGVQGLATDPSTSILAQPAPSSRPKIAETGAPERSPGTFAGPGGEMGANAAPDQPAPNAAAPVPNGPEIHSRMAPNVPAPERYAAPKEPAPNEPGPVAPGEPRDARPGEPRDAPPGEPRDVAPGEPRDARPGEPGDAPYAMPDQRRPAAPHPYAMPNEPGPAVPHPYAMPNMPAPEHGPNVMSGPPAAAPEPHGARPEPFDTRARPRGGACGPDRGLFGQVVAVLPAVRGAVAQPLDGPRTCPAGVRAVQVRVTDHGATGLLRVLLAPPGFNGVTVPGQSQSVRSETARTAGGARLIVWVTASEPGRIPYANQLVQLAHALAAQNH